MKLTPKTLWIATHDAGGAEILSSYLKGAPPPYPVRCILEGPAQTIFSRKLPSIISESRLALSQMQASDFLLTGSGWASDLERVALAQAKQSETRSATFLDHWANYKERFLEKGELKLPDEIWVGDQEAEKIAKSEFQNIPIVLVENPYFIEIREEVKRARQQENSQGDQNTVTNIVYICEALSEHHLDWAKESPEFTAILRFLRWLQSSSPTKGEFHIVFRLHPAEKPGKYDAFLSTLTDLGVHFSWEVSTGKSLAQDLAQTEMVAGMSSAALAVALFCGKRVVSCMPTPKYICTLPQPEIERI